ATARETTDAAKQRVFEKLPLAQSQPSADLYMQQRIAQLQQGSKFTPPPVPAPIFEEYQRVLRVLQGRPGVELQSIMISAPSCEILLRVPDTRTGEEIALALSDPSMAVAWNLQRGASTQL